MKNYICLNKIIAKQFVFTRIDTKLIYTFPVRKTKGPRTVSAKLLIKIIFETLFLKDYNENYSRIISSLTIILSNADN